MAKKDTSIDITEYVERATETFDERALTAVDSLVFTTLFYVKLETILAGEQAKADAAAAGSISAAKNRRNGEIGDASSSVISAKNRRNGKGSQHLEFSVKDFWKTEYYETAFNDGIADAGNRRTMGLAAGSRRFRDVPVRDIVAITDYEREMQFAACVFEVTDDTDYVAFRGTDGDMIGWREDFNLTFLDKAPSQLEATDYINRLYGPGGPREKRKLYIGGHSKGGHLALYSAVMCDNSIKDRLLEVFCHDSVGFRPETYARFRQRHRLGDIKINKTVPQNSLIGQIMRSDMDYDVVRSSVTGGIAQHNAFTWRIEGNDFAKLEGDKTKGSYNHNAIADWLSRADDNRRRLFTEAIFGAFDLYGVKTVKQLAQLKTADYFRIIDTFKDLDPEIKTAVNNCILKLMGALVIPRGTKKAKR